MIELNFTFFPVKLEYRETTVDISDNPLEIFENKKCISIIGFAGSGKSMLMKHIFLKTLENYRLIPLVIELRFLNDYQGNLTDYIYDKILNNRLSPNNKILERILAEGNFLFLFDGYDEIYSKSKSKITNEIDKFIDRYSKNRFIITSRPGANVESVPRFDSMYVKSLEKGEIETFINVQLAQTDYPEMAKKIIEAIKKGQSESYQAYLGNPLLLSMFILTFESHPVLPKLKSRFYWNVFDTLASRHDSVTKKGGYQHERRTNLQAEELESILKWFSYHSLFEGKFSFDRQYLSQKLQAIKTKLKYTCNVDDLIDDLTISLAIMIIDGLEFKFPHRSMQEYFAATLIKDLPRDIKPKIYEEKVGARYETLGEVNNFWELCLELDKNDFMQFCILKKLESFYLSMTTPTTDAERMLKYYAIIEISNRVVINIKDQRVTTTIELQTVNHFNQVMGFLNKAWFFHPFLTVAQLNDIYPELIADGIMEEVEEDELMRDEGTYLGEDSQLYRLDYAHNFHDMRERLIEILLDLGFADIVNGKITLLKKMIDEIKEDIKQENDNTLALLE